MSSSVCTTIEMHPTFPHIMEFSRNSNKAGSPLPSIPRRMSSSSSARPRHIQSISDSCIAVLASSTPSTRLYVQPPTPPVELMEASTSQPSHVAFPATGDGNLSSSSSSSDGSQPTIDLHNKKSRGRQTSAQATSAQSSSTFDTAKRERPYRTQSLATSPSGNTSVVEGTQLRRTPSRALKLRLNVEAPAIHTRHVSDSVVDALVDTIEPARSAPLRTVSTAATLSAAAALATPGLVRKKTGEPIKSSLKGSRTLSISVVGGTTSKSAPSTPTPSKAVHFDARLEHVKLFLAEQKPLAVSRDGSPTDDTSGTESDFPSFIYGRSSEEDRARKDLVMQVTNMPVYTQRRLDADVALQELSLSSDSLSINGRIRVKNLAFEKRLAVRFTFDLWQTTSEVTAKYVESVEGGNFDIFNFAIRLNDIISRIESKELFLALRYNVGGKEIWDNNSGQNYLAKFSRKKVESATTSDDEGMSSAPALSDLKKRLEQVVKVRDNPVNFLAERVHRQARSESPKAPSFQSEQKLSSRYDFSNALKNQSWKAAPPAPTRHVRTITFPDSPGSPPNSVPWPRKPSPPSKKSLDLPPRSPHSSVLGSPGLDDLLRMPISAGSNVEDVKSKIPSPPGRIPTHSQQSAYFDRNISESSWTKPNLSGIPNFSPTLGGTLDSTPLMTPHHMPRTNSFPPTDMRPSHAPFVPAWAEVLQTGGSAESTPSVTTSASSSRDSSPGASPTVPEDYSSIINRYAHFTVCISPLATNDPFLLHRLCFFTGGGSESFMSQPVEQITRSHSASSVDELLYQQTPVGSFTSSSSFPSATPTRRSPSFDEVTFRSGSSTPTANSSLIFSESRSPTPVMG